jgi:virulence-associated protein VagC
MKTRIQKWGNSLALRIPKSFAAESHLEQGMLVDVSLHDGKLLVTPSVHQPSPWRTSFRASPRRTSITKSTRDLRWGMKHGRAPRRVCASPWRGGLDQPSSPSGARAGGSAASGGALPSGLQWPSGVGCLVSHHESAHHRCGADACHGRRYGRPPTQNAEPLSVQYRPQRPR